MKKPTMILGLCVSLSGCMETDIDKAYSIDELTDCINKIAGKNNSVICVDMPEYYEMLEIGKLDLYYPVKIRGLEGECFMYSIYFENADINVMYDELQDAVTKFSDAHGEDDYQGYISITNAGDKVTIYHDIGSTDGSNGPIHGMLKTFNSIKGIKNVIINEDYVPMSEDEMMERMLEIMRQNGFEG